MRALFTGDIHLTDNPKDEYRWDVFPWLARVAKKRKVDRIFILGDLTDRKDRHPARLVHRVIASIEQLSKVAKVHILKGNHDFDTDPGQPFFGFMDQFIVDPTEMNLPGGKTAYLIPHDHDVPPRFPAGYDFILLHHTFKGAKASNGARMSGWSRKAADPTHVGDALVLSGDIHVPQKLGNVTYTGSPHPVHFGDTFTPRVLFYDGTRLRSIKRKTIRKPILRVTALEELAAAGLTEGDQVKVRYQLPRREFHTWADRKAEVAAYCKDVGIELHGLSLEPIQAKRTKRKRTIPTTRDPSELFAAFCKATKVDADMMDIGKDLL